jgi:hypothetical protein
MVGYRAYSLSLVICAAAVAIIWAVAVPGVLSGATFGAVAVIVLALAVVLVISVQSGRSTRSVAHVLHDTETDGDVLTGPAGGR